MIKWKRNNPDAKAARWQVELVSFSFSLLLLGVVLIWTGSLAAEEAASNSLRAGEKQTESPLLGFHLGKGDGPHMEAARAAGGRFVVVVFSWADIEPEPNYLYWETPDAALRAAEFYGLEVVARLDRPPAWAMDKSQGAEKLEADPTPWRLDAYANFARRVTERYGDRLAGLILWNEPNLSLEWAGQSPDPEAYVALLEETYPAIKAAAPDLPVLLAGLAFTEGEDIQAVDDLAYLRAIYAAGGSAYFDVLAAHPYGFGRPPLDSPQPERLNFRRLELHRQIMESHGDGHKPVWITEMGWRTRAPDPKDAWQVVTPAQQKSCILQAIAYSQKNYPWLERMALWELNNMADHYGYALWQGPDQVSPAYKALAARCEQSATGCPAPPEAGSGFFAASSPVSILASDVIIRLGDVGTLHPHWVHLYQSREKASLNWQGEFFLRPDQAQSSYDLVVETMQVDQVNNNIQINGQTVARLHPRTRPDVTSTWVTQRFAVSSDLLQAGRNTMTIRSGLRNPARQYDWWRWENMQFRHVRLVSPQVLPPSFLDNWKAQAAPSGWSEINRLRPGPVDLEEEPAELWVTGLRPGQLWMERLSSSQNTLKETGEVRLENQAGNRPDLVFNDVLPLPGGELAATAEGLLWRSAGDPAWQPVSGSPSAFAYVVMEVNDRFYAGFEQKGVWSASQPAGPWRPNGLSEHTVLDLASGPEDNLYAATDVGVFSRHSGPDSAWRSLPPPGLTIGEQRNFGQNVERFITRLYVGQEGELVVRNQDQLWQWDASLPNAWQPFGPASLSNQLLSLADCCEAGTVIGSNQAGVWRLGNENEWTRLDNNFFDPMDVTGLARLEDILYAGGGVGLFYSADGEFWQKAKGLPATITDLVVDPADASRWVAGTPAGIYLSQDRGGSWKLVSPPWTVWDMAFGPQGRLFVARAEGLVWADEVKTGGMIWSESDGLEGVLFFSVNPHPAEADIVWAGTWGNNVAVSRDGGLTFEPLHNGLETLSVLDVLWHPTPGQVTLATIEGLYRTDDGGQSWFLLPGPLTRQTVHRLLLGEDGTIWAAAADGLWRSQDYGVTWQQATGLPAVTVLRLGKLISPQDKLWLWAGTEEDGLWVSKDGGMSWRFGGLENQSVYNLFFDPERPKRLVAATHRGIFEEYVD